MTKARQRQVVMLLGLLWAATAAGCAVDPGKPDPWEGFNRVMYDFNEGLDRHLLEPLASAYTSALPLEVRRGVGNGLDNLTYGNTIVNSLLQGKLEQGGRDALRMLVNSTLGLAGLFDPATDLGLAKHSEDFGQTLAVWGVGQGPYLVLPVLGPSSGRDVWALPVGVVTNPLFWIDPPLYVTIPLAVLGTVDGRARADSAFRLRTRAALDPYVFTRDAYLQRRLALVSDEQAPPPAIDYFDDDEPETAPATQPQR